MCFRGKKKKNRERGELIKRDGEKEKKRGIVCFRGKKEKRKKKKKKKRGELIERDGEKEKKRGKKLSKKS